jgi:hypothetical protein
MESLEGDKFLVEQLMISFDLASISRIVLPAEDQFDTVFRCFSFEDLGDELFSIIEINSRRIHPARSAQRRALITDAVSL